MGRSLWWSYKNSFFYNYTIHPDNWFTNGTFNYTDFNEDVSSAEGSLHPAGDIDISGVKAATLLNFLVFVALMILYEVLRKYFPYVYASKTEQEERLSKENAETHHSINLPDILRSSKPLEWVWPVFGISWKTVRREGGLDAYFYLRYIRMCLRITSVSAFWGMILLFPVFATGGNGAIGWCKSYFAVILIYNILRSYFRLNLQNRPFVYGKCTTGELYRYLDPNSVYVSVYIFCLVRYKARV